MNEVLQQINTVPGVMGSMICNEDGGIVADLFPPLFDRPMLQEAANLVGECAYGLHSVDDNLNLLDIRYQDVRILIQPMASRFLLLFCQKTINLQFLAITLKVATKRLEKKMMEPAIAPSPQIPAPVEPSASRVPKQALPEQLPTKKLKEIPDSKEFDFGNLIP